MARSASVLTLQEVKLLNEIGKHGQIVSIQTEIGKAVALRRLESKGLLEKIPVPTYQLSRLGQHALAFHKEVESFNTGSTQPRAKRKNGPKQRPASGASAAP